MNDFLKKIIAERRLDIAKAKKTLSLSELQNSAVNSKLRHRSLAAALKSNQKNNRGKIIAEIKRASPSEGQIRADLNPARLARAYAQAGATAISVLTEPHYFLGLETDLKEVSKAVDIPILRKDFIVEPYQIYESAAWGADVVLLIAAAMDKNLLSELYETAEKTGLEAIIEIHSAAELETALHFEKAIIGVNNRDLTTLKTDLATAAGLAPLIPKERIAIAESGIKSRREIERLVSLGYRGFLVGTALLKAKSPGAALAELIGQTEGTK